MVSQQTTRQAVDILSTAIVEMIEDIHPDAVLSSVVAPHHRSDRFKQVGEDIVTLAAAIIVMQRLEEKRGG